MSNIIIHMKFYGSFRKYGEDLNLSVSCGSTIASIKAALVKALNGDEKNLIAISVLANDNAILHDKDVIEADMELSILPPICGG